MKRTISIDGESAGVPDSAWRIRRRPASRGFSGA
jgi:hypothetical protein